MHSPHVGVRIRSPRAHGLVVPHIIQTIDSTVEAINDGLASLKAGRGVRGKVALIVNRDLALGTPSERSR